MKRISALIVDDEELARKNLEFLLKDEGGYVVMKKGERIPVSRRRKDAFLQLFHYQ